MRPIDVTPPSRAGATAPLAAIAVLLALAGALAVVDPLAGAVLLAGPLVPLGMFVALKGTMGDRSYGQFLALAVIFITAANFRFRDYDDKSIDLQVLLKLACIGLMILVSLVFAREIVRFCTRLGFVFWIAFFGFLVVSSSYAMNPPHAFVASLSHLAAFLFMAYLIAHFGPDRAVVLLVLCGALLCLGSLAVYVAVPSFGRMSDWVGNEFVVTSRLQGLFGASNGAGLAGAQILFLALTLYPREGRWARAVIAVTALAALLCLVLSNNRMAVFALGLAAMFLYVLRGRSALKLFLLLAVAPFLVSVVLLFADDILSAVSRSGDAAEVTSATGRTRIWPVVLHLWSQTPILGRGFGSSQYILPYEPDLFIAAAHAHNMYLEQLFAGGIVALALMVIAVLSTLGIGYLSGRYAETALLILVLFYGLTEPVVAGPAYYGSFVLGLVVGRITMRRPLTAPPQ